jgi:hypothetical protein
VIFRFIAYVFSFLAILTVAVATFIFFYATPETVKPVIEKYLTAQYGRATSIGQLHYQLDVPTRIELEDVHFANPSWGSSPDMVRIDHLTVLFDPHSLLKGGLQIDKLLVDGLLIVLERDPDGRGNWKMGAGKASPPPIRSGNDAIDVESRKNLPVILDMAVHNSRITFRTSSHALLKIDFHEFTLHAESHDGPVSLKVKGAYNDIPVTLDVAAESFDRLHDYDEPFHAKIAAVGSGLTVHMNAAMMDPLNFEDVDSALQIETKKLGESLAIFGSEFQADLPLYLEGNLKHKGDLWRIRKSSGALGHSKFDGDLELREGARLQPDNVLAGLNFDEVNIDQLMAESHRRTPPHGYDARRLPEIERKPGLLVDTVLATKDLIYKDFKAADFKIHILIKSGVVQLDDIAASFLGGKISASFDAAALNSGSKIFANVSATGMDIDRILHLTGVTQSLITGGIDTKVILAGQGETLDDLMQTAHGSLVIATENAQISEKAMQLAAADPGVIFSNSGTMIPVTCALGVATLKDGNLFITPFRIVSSDGTLFGGGHVDLVKHNLDLTFKTDGKTTAFLALDLPIHAVGSFDDIHFAPHLNSAIKDLKAQALGNMEAMTPTTQSMARGSPCAN